MIDTPFLETKEIALRELQRGDLAGRWYTWLNDAAVTRWQNKGILPNTREKQTAYFEAVSNSSSDVVLAIIHRKSGTHIGNVGLHRIDWVHRSAEIGIMVGEKKFWGKGYGRQAWQLMTEYAFKKLNLHRLFAWILEENLPSLKAAEASGFRKEGRIRDVLYKDGAYHAMIYMNVLEKDFQSNARSARSSR